SGRAATRDGQDLAERRDADAKLRDRADELRAAISRGRRRAHRAADRRERHEPRDCRRPCADSRAERVLPHGEHALPLSLFRDLLAANLERAAVLVVDDFALTSSAGSALVRLWR